MNDARIDLLRRQFDLTWGLLEYHLDRLVPEDVLWEPVGLCWTMHRSGDGWAPDWADSEPDPIPVPTVGWVTWHIGWWWGVTLDHLAGRVPRDREAVAWPGPDGVVEWLSALREEWLTVLPTVSLDAPAPFPWPEGSGMTVADTAAWVNAELMKNAAELGQLRLLRAASSANP